MSATALRKAARLIRSRDANDQPVVTHTDALELAALLDTVRISACCNECLADESARSPAQEAVVKFAQTLLRTEP